MARDKGHINEHGLLVLAKSDLKISYLMENNFRTIRTQLRSRILSDKSLDDVLKIDADEL